jgi:hypothetical protein
MKPVVRALCDCNLSNDRRCTRQEWNGHTRRPNILLIVSDDWATLIIGVYGSRDIPTPKRRSPRPRGGPVHKRYVSGPLLQSNACVVS